MVDFKRYIKARKSPSIQVASFINLILLLFVVFITFQMVSGFQMVSIKLPKVVTSDAIGENNLVILLTGEDVFYYNNKVITLSELKGLFRSVHQEGMPILIKVDRKSSAGRLVDLWTLARVEGVSRVNIVTGP